MSVQFSVAVRNARLDAIETAIGTAPILRILTGSKPATCADSQTGTLLVEMTLPSDWLAAASSGVKAKSGTWEDPSANAGGTAGYFRILDSSGTTCHMQGNCTDLAGAGPLKLTSVVVVSAEPVSVGIFDLTDGNA
jgi:hypothetical protein